MEGEFIIMGFLMLVGQIIMLQMWNMNWFKRENFKVTKSNMMAQNRLQIKKMEKELGLKAGKDPVEPKGTFGTLKDLAPLLSKLNPDTIDLLADKFLAGSGEELIEGSDGGGGIPGALLQYAEENPEVVQSFLKGITEGKRGKDATPEHPTQVPKMW